MANLGLTLRAAQPQALATLIRVLGDMTLAEDVLQEACLRAVGSWPRTGIPDSPVAWLVATARNHAIDLFRRRALEDRHAGAIAALADAEQAAWTDIETAADDGIKDDLARLIFTCCHPALAPEAQIALTLKTIAGLSVEEIAHAFLAAPRTMEQRLVRAKRKIRDAGIPYAVPAPADLPDRLNAALQVAYLIFNEGYKASRGDAVVRSDLAAQAIRLGRILARLFRGEPEVTGLLALMLLQHARRDARADNEGDLVPLDEQDRDVWNKAMIAEGRALTEKALRRKRPGPFQIQAAIAAVHDAAPRYADTDWQEIAALYERLERYQPSPVVTLNRAVAVAQIEGPQTGLDMLESIAGSPDMERYRYFHATRAAFLADLGDHSGARAAYERALLLAENCRERAFLEKKIGGLK